VNLLTNFERMPEHWAAGPFSGKAIYGQAYEDFRRLAPSCDFVLVNGDILLLLKLCLYFWIHPSRRKPIVAVDLVLRRPRTWKQKLLHWPKRLLLDRVDHFIHYFQDLAGYTKYFAITPDRSSFVPFKPNLRYRYEPVEPAPEGDYVLCFGRSQRDYDTFFQTMSALPYPAAIPRPDFAGLREHDSRFTWRLADLPPNIQVLDDDGSQDSMIRIAEKAKIVALPILPSTLAASGISVYLNVMLLERPVVITAGPGVSDLLTDQAVIVPPEDPAALAAAIRHLWEDDAFRASTAAAGRRYALQLGGEPELFIRIVEAAASWYQKSRQT
jgi:glycosyltransferase involved in cell wall biosynthesis